MNAKRMRLAAVVLSAMALSAPATQARGPNLIITNLRGSLHISQAVPCGGVVEATTSIADGRMHIAPSSSRTDTVFDLTRLEMFLTPFSAQHECLGVNANVEFREIGLRLANAIRFTGQTIGPGQYRFVIPKEQFLIYESVLNNLPGQQPQTGYKRPSEDVTGEIDTRRGTADLHIVLSSRLRVHAGCIGKRCVIDEVVDGTQTAAVTGRILEPGTDSDNDGVPDLTDNCPLVPNADQAPVATPQLTPPDGATVSSCQTPDLGTAEAIDVCRERPVALTNNAPAKFAIGRNVVTWRASDGIDPVVTAQQLVTVSGVDVIPPTLSCTQVAHPRQHRVAAADDCGGRLTLKLGTFSLVNNEVIQIEETGKPGVRLLGTVGADKIRHFQVGKGEALVMATDDSGNVARAACGVPLDITRQ